MIKSFQLLVVLLPVLTGTSHSGGGDGGELCPRAPAAMMTAEQACSAVCGTRHMHRLCLRTLLPPRRRHGMPALVPVTHHAAVAARCALESYGTTAATARKTMLHRRGADAVPTDERVAYAGCVDGYEAARRSMGRVADDLQLLAMASSSSSSCAAAAAAAAARLARDYTGGLRGMDACSKSLLGFPASPMYGMNLADRNKTLLAALLCSLVPMPPGKHGAVHA